MSDIHMGDAAHNTNALKRKASAGHRVREAQGLSPARAMRLAVARAAGDLWELPLTVTGMRHELIAIEDIPDRLSNETMLMLLDGPNACRGGLSVDRNLLTSVTEVQTLGQVTDRASGDRALTPTDAALFSPLLDALMERLDVILSGGSPSDPGSEARWILGYRFGAMVDDVRSLSIALEGEDFHFLSLDLDIAAGMRRGQMIMCLPEFWDNNEQPAETGDASLGAHAASLSLVEAALTAYLPKIILPLSQASSLKPGDELPLELHSIDAVTLRAPDGEVLARCSLGKANGKRALRLNGRPGQSATTAISSGSSLAASTTGADIAPPPEDIANLVDMSPPSPIAEGDSEDDLPDLPDLPPLDFTEAPEVAVDLEDMPTLAELPDISGEV